jgi:hypothetical protein
MSLWGKVKSAFGGRDDGDAGGGKPRGTTPQDLFAAQVEAAFREASPAAALTRHPSAFGLLLKRDGNEQHVFLDNVFRETRDLDPDARRERIRRFVRSMAHPDVSAMSWEEVRPKLAPLLRTSSLLSGVIAGDGGPVNRPFLPFLVECVGIDSNDGIAYVMPHLVDTWGVTLSDVFAAATENARRFFQDDVDLFDSEAPYPLWHVSRDDSYESSRILVPGWLAAFRGKVTGRPVAIVPHRGLLVVGGDGDDACLRRLVASAKAEFEASPRSVSPALYTVDDRGAVVPLVLPAGHPLADDVVVGHVMHALGEYEPQKQRLQEKEGDAAFVASLYGLKGKSGGVYSYTTWSRDVPSLLPRADQVAMVLEPGVEGGEIFSVPWPSLLDLAGELLVPEPHVQPPRWRTSGWPDDAMLDMLRRVAVR